MRTFKYVEPADDDGTPVRVTVTEEDIRREYWPVWEKRMIEINRTPIFEQCVEDFCSVHWANEVKQDTPE
jgi:hypothetical protein